MLQRIQSIMSRTETDGVPTEKTSQNKIFCLWSQTFRTPYNRDGMRPKTVSLGASALQAGTVFVCCTQDITFTPHTGSYCPLYELSLLPFVAPHHCWALTLITDHMQRK